MRLIQISLYLCLSATAIAQQNCIINIDFGGTDTALPWNTLTNSINGDLANLWTLNGKQTEIGIEVNKPFNGTNSSGTNSADPALLYPSFASSDSFFGNSEEFSGIVRDTAGVKIYGLDISNAYDLNLFASRLASDNRETAYHIQASNKDTIVFLDASDNTSNICLLYTSPSPRDQRGSRMPSSA